MLDSLGKLAQTAAVVGLGAAALAPAATAAPIAPAGFSTTVFAGAPSGATGPDDIAALGTSVAVAWQNGIGALGEPAASGATQSDVVLYARNGLPRRDWKLTGHVDGLAADTARGELVATVNEDGNTSLFTIDARLSGSQPVQYAFSPEPDSKHTGGVFTGGGTDGVQVLPDGSLLISASAPNDGTGGPVANATATFHATLDRRSHIARLAPTFADNAKATNGLTGESVTLGVPGSNPQALTDPDSNALVPSSSPLYEGQYMLNSQGDQQLVFARPLEAGKIGLTELPLSKSGTAAGVDDVSWATGKGGTLYVVDHGANAVYALTGPFAAGESFAGLDSIGETANTTELDRLDLASGGLTSFVTGFQAVKGLLYVPSPARCGGGVAGSSCAGTADARSVSRSSGRR